MSNKSLLPSPARSQGAITPRRYRPRSSRSVGSPARSNTSTRLTSLIENVFEPSPISKRRSVLNDDSDIIAPSRRSWWKNLGENSRDIGDVLQNEDIAEANNIIEEFDMEVLSQEKKNYTLDLQDSSDGESIRSIIIPHHKLFSEKENATKKEYKDIMKNRETLNKSRAQKSSVDCYKDVSFEPKNLFSQNEKRSKPVFPAALLNVSANKTIAEKSMAHAEPKNQGRNLFGNRPAAKRKNMFINFIVSDSEEEIPEIQAKVLTLKRPSLSKQQNSSISNMNSPAQSIIDIEMDDWKLLPSSTMVEHQFEEQATPKRTRQSKLSDVNERNKSYKHALQKQIDNIDNLLDFDNDDINITLKDPIGNRSYFPAAKQKFLISNAINETNGALKSKSVLHESNKTINKIADSKPSKTMIGHTSKNDMLEENSNEMDNSPLNDEFSDDEQENSRLRYEEDEYNNSDKSKNSKGQNHMETSITDNTRQDKFEDKIIEQIKGSDRKSKNESQLHQDDKKLTDKENNLDLKNYENTVQENEATQHNDNLNNVALGESFVEQDPVEVDQEEKQEESKIELENKRKELEVEEEQQESEVEQEESEVEQEESEVEQEESEVEQEESEVEQEESEAEQDESEADQVDEVDQEDSEIKQQVSELEENDSQIEEVSEIQENDDNGTYANVNCSADMDLKYDNPNIESNPNHIAINNQNQLTENNGDENDNSHDNDKLSIISNSPHDANNSKENKNDKIKSPEAILKDKSGQGESFFVHGRNTSVRKTKSVNLKNLDIRLSLAPVRESIEFSDGNRESSANNSGWDSHRTTRKTMRQTFGKDFTPRKSLRTLVMEKSAKRQTNVIDNEEISKLPQANSTEYPQFESMANHMDVEESVQESDHEMSKRTRQTTLEIYLQKIKIDNMDRKRKIEEEIRNSLKTSSQKFNNLFKIPQKPPVRRAIKTNNNNKPKAKTHKHLIPLDILPEEVLEDLKYKPPKRYQPKNASWVTKRLYKFLETKLEPQYDYKARVRAEKLVEVIFNFTRDIRRNDVAPEQTVDSLKQEMARLHIVNTHFDFYEFFKNYMPRDVRNKVVPDVVNKIALPKPNVFAEILR